MVDRDELAVEDAELLAVALAHRRACRADPVLLELGLDQREGQRRADEREVGLEAQQVGHGADVVLVAVGEDHRLHVVEPVLDVVEVRQDQVDAGVVVVGEQHAAVDDEQLAAVLDDGHVAADLAEAAERDDAHGAVGEGAGQLELGVRVAHRVGSVARAARSSSRCSGGDSTSGSRTAADSMTPELDQRGLGHDRPLRGAS